MINPNIFKPRNDWNIVVFNSKKCITYNFEEKLAKIIEDETKFNPFMNTKYQKGNYVLSRQLFMVFMVKHTNLSYETIAVKIGKDHATVSHALKAIQDRYDTDKRFKELYDLIETKVKNIH